MFLSKTVIPHNTIQARTYTLTVTYIFNIGHVKTLLYISDFRRELFLMYLDALVLVAILVLVPLLLLLLLFLLLHLLLVLVPLVLLLPLLFL